MLTVHELEGLRRSLAMAPLSAEHVHRLIDECDQHLRERQRIAAVLAELPASVAALRSTLNELHQLVKP